VTCYTEGFSHFVTSMTAPVASGWSVRRVGLAPTGKRRLLTAHANSGRSLTLAEHRHDHLGNTGRKTGFWLEELAAPYYVFEDAGAPLSPKSPINGTR